MPSAHSPSRPFGPLVRYAGGLLCVVAGAGLAAATGSMLPLAAGAAVAILCTASLVESIMARAAARRARQ